MRLKCDTCGTVIENNFDFPKIMKLSKDQLEFATVFLKNRGNIKDVERELGISYPTVRAKLDQIIELISDGSAKTALRIEKEEVLQKLENGELTAEEAIASLNKMK